MNLLEKIYKWLNFQKNYDWIKSWKLSPDIDKLFDEIWANIPSTIQKAMYDLLKAIYDKYGPDAAIILLKKILEAIRNQVYLTK